ncbi:MAG: FmdE family protein [Methylocystaceae bacterium]
MCQDMSPVEKAIMFHGHICPGLLMGVRMAEAALNKLGVSSDQDEELLAIVENDSCSVDAIQAILGCTFGKGNLIFKDYGKQVVTVASRQHNKAVRIAGRKLEPTAERQRFTALNRLAQLTAEEEAEKESLRMAIFEQVMSCPVEEMLDIREVKIEWPPKAVIYQTVTCSSCGEGVSGHRVVETERGPLCLPCSKGERY